MPELPEVEVTRLSIADRIAGALILEVRQGKPLRWPLQVEPESLVGRRLVAVRRRGKYLLLEMDQGLLLMHLGMSGSLSFAASASEMGKHDHFDLQTTQGILRLNDPRRFGAVVYVRNEQDPVAEKLLGRLGMEPLGSEFDPLRFFQALRARKTSIKQILLAGDVVVGVGNIYACEALFLAGIRPTVAASRLSRRRTDRLHHAICEVLLRAVAMGGSTLRNFSNAQGQDGHFQQEAMVYGRKGQDCKVCETPVCAIRQGQRSTFFCPKCQKP